MTAHNPGPWKFEQGADNESNAKDSAGTITDKGGWHIARVWGDLPSTMNPQANGRLIAAAPALLAALQEVERYSAEYPILEARVLGIVRPAIAQAIGP
jgi:hypothetical protein